MSPIWERRFEAPPPPQGALHMDAVLTPNRSLSLKAFTLLACVFAAINAAMAVMFALQGAYPVLAFLGLDVGLLLFAFWANYRAGRAKERVQVAADRVHVARHPVKGRPEHWVTSPAWARVDVGETEVRVAAGGRDVPVGGFLSPEERTAFAGALRTAIARARADRA